MSCTVQYINEFLAKGPCAACSLSQSHSKQRAPLRPNPRIPLSFKCIIVYEGGVSTVLPLLVLLLHGREVSVWKDIVGEDQELRVPVELEVARGGGGKLADQGGIFWGAEDRGTSALCFELDRPAVESLHLFLSLAFVDGVSNRARVEPERIAAIGERNFERLDRRLNGCNEYRSVVPALTR